MNSIVAFVVILLVGLIIWLASRHSRSKAQQTVLERNRILKELDELKKKRQGAIDDAARRGVTISTDRVLKHVENLKEAYVSSGDEEAAREVERIIRDFREQNGPEIPVEKAYALMKEIEDKYGQ